MPGDRGEVSVMPSPLRRPSRSVRVPGRVSKPVRLGHQSTGSFFTPYLDRPDTSGESLQRAHGLATLLRNPEEASPADAGPAGAGPAGAGPAGAGPANVGPAVA